MPMSGAASLVSKLLEDLSNSRRYYSQVMPIAVVLIGAYEARITLLVKKTMSRGDST